MPEYSELIVPPDLIAVVRDYLNEEMPAWLTPTPAVYTRVPNPRPERFIRIDPAGGGRRDVVVFETVLMFEAWAPADIEAMDTIQIVRALLHAMPIALKRLGVVMRVNEYAAPSLMPDPVSGSPRGMFTAQFVTPGQTIGSVAVRDIAG